MTPEERSLEGKKQKAPFVHGGSSLLMAVLLVMVLVVLALMTLSAARNDLEFSRKMAEKNTLYYQACNQAEERLAQVSRVLEQAHSRGESPNFSGLEVTVRKDTVDWEIPIQDRQVLAVAVDRHDGSVVRWQVVSTQPWTEEDSISMEIP